VKNIVKNVRQLHTAANSYTFVEEYSEENSEEYSEEYIVKKIVNKVKK
jgi:hypothetical protein